MSIPRYSPNPLWIGMPIVDNKEGKLCEYRDYAKLEDTLNCSFNSNRELKIENARLKAEVERLRYVGDGMAVMVGHIEVTGDAHRMMLELSKEWNAAKEGKSV